MDWTDPDQSPEKENEAFQRAMALAGSEFLRQSDHGSRGGYIFFFPALRFALLSDIAPFSFTECSISCQFMVTSKVNCNGDPRG